MVAVLYGIFSGACGYPDYLFFGFNCVGLRVVLTYLFFCVDIGLAPALVGSMAKDDSEIGARLGVCFTFTG